jgi:2-succinyl-5-enolpyruvyl-6-hydroxy-3-cyclohexene-1-carboxylate synthase
VLGASPDDLTDVAAWWSDTLGWPVLAEPVSNARVPGAAMAAGQAAVADGAWSIDHRPDLVIQLGATPTTRAMQTFVASAERLVVADRWHLDPDPERAATWRIAVDADVLTDVLHERPVRVQAAPEEWTSSWADADGRARAALDGYLDGIDDPFEPRIARDVAACVPDGGTLFVGNSTPIRDLDLAMAPRTGLRVLANRGASGVDGLVSTVLGVAASSVGPTVGLLGDLSYLYDLGAIVWSARRGTDATLVVVNNGGGEVFSLLPQRELPEHRDLFVTPHGANLGELTKAAGAGHTVVGRSDELTPAVLAATGAGGPQVVEVVVDAERSLARRAELRGAIAAALA